MKLEKLKKRVGLTLIEILVGFAILALGIIGVIALFPIGMDAQTKNEMYTSAANLANKWVALYQTLGWRNGYTPGGGYTAWRTDGEFPKLEFQTAFADRLDAAASSDAVSIKVRYYNRGKAAELSFGEYYIQSYD